MLDEIFNSYQTAASDLANWKQLDKNEIANLYLDHRYNEKSSSIYAAALICRYWYKVGLLWKHNQQALTQEECYWIVCDGINQAMNYAAWRNPENSLYQDPNGPDKAINICIETKRKEFYDFSNRDKRKTNHKSNISSLEDLYEKTKDYSFQLATDFSDGWGGYETQSLYLNSLITYFIKRGQLPEAILLDNICYGDSTVEESDGVRFSVKKLITTIHLLDKTFIEYFAQTYDVPIDVVQDCVLQLQSLSHWRMHKLLRRTLFAVRQGEEYR